MPSRITNTDESRTEIRQKPTKADGRAPAEQRNTGREAQNPRRRATYLEYTDGTTNKHRRNPKYKQTNTDRGRNIKIRRKPTEVHRREERNTGREAHNQRRRAKYHPADGPTNKYRRNPPCTHRPREKKNKKANEANQKRRAKERIKEKGERGKEEERPLPLLSRDYYRHSAWVAPDVACGEALARENRRTEETKV